MTEDRPRIFALKRIPPSIEHLLGWAMLELAASEGHTRGLPKNTKQTGVSGGRNEGMVIAEIARSGPISVACIVRATGVKASTVKSVIYGATRRGDLEAVRAHRWTEYRIAGK